MTHTNLEAPVTAEQAARFWSKVAIGKPDECWPWTGHTNPKGYGRMHLSGKKRYPATRISWCIANEAAWPEGKLALHTCDNPICVNPRHIWPGTNSENRQDSIKKGRTPSGPELPLCDLGHRKIKSGSGYMRCATCHAAYSKAWRAKQREEIARLREVAALTLPEQPRQETLFDAIAHGDEVHRAWLKEAIDNHFAGRPVPQPREQPRPVDDVERMREALREAFITSEAKGHPDPAERSYRLILKFPDLERLHAGHAAIITALQIEGGEK